MTILRAKKIEEINANQFATEYTSWCKNNSQCLYKSKKRKFHKWLNLSHLQTKEKVAQCGWDNGNCNHETHYGIGGYHNICPIAGINGDYVWPAKLQFSNFDFKSNNITSTANIKSITVHFEHRMVAIDTKTGKKYDNFGPTFHSNSSGWVAKIYFTKNNTKISKTITCNNNPKLSKKDFSGFSCTFNNISIDDVLNNNFKLNIEYNHNYNTNPGIIYIKNVYIDVKYDNAQLYLTGSTDNKTLYTSKNENCKTEITHTIEAGYKNNKTKIPPNQAPQKLGNKIQCVDHPKNVSVREISSNDTRKIYKITDLSEEEGIKKITYSLSNNKKKKVKLEYEAIKRNKPTYNLVTQYKFNEDFDSSKAYITFKNGCASKIYIYVDYIDTEPIELTVSNQNSSSNLLNQTSIECFHSQIKTLSCGNHTLYIKRDDESIENVKKNTVFIQILPMNFKFDIYTNENDNHKLNFIQSKVNQTRYSEIIIKRVDNEPISEIPSLLIYDETDPSSVTEVTDVKKDQEITHTIDKYYAGDFYISLKNNDGCSRVFNKTKITIESSHKQNYDFLFTRGEYGTGLDFDYLVAWEGDNIKKPIEIDSIELINSTDDIRICSNSAKIGLSQIGLIQLNIKNQTNKEINGLELELNTLINDDNGNKVITTREWTDIDGIFKDFYSLFYLYNKPNNDIKILNLTPDGDFVDEENVYLSINTINANDTIEIYLPFRSITEKKVFLQYLLFEEPLKINSLSSCNSLSQSNNDFIEIDVYDSMLTNLEIFGNTDLLVLDPSYECPDECYTTKETESGIPITNEQTGGITYKITNIDTNDFSNKSLRTKIINSNEMIPYGYIIDNSYYPLLTNNNEAIPPQTNKLELIQKDVTKSDIVMSNQLVYCTVQFQSDSEPKTYAVRTNTNGLAEFFIPIPNTIQTSYTINDLLDSVLYFEFKGNSDSNSFVLSNNQNITISGSFDSDKNNTTLRLGNNYKKYRPGDIAYIPIFLSTDITVRENYFLFYPKLKDNGESDEITILYKICNIENNQGIFKTTFKTDDISLIENEVSKSIYCGIPTKTTLKTKIEKRLVELNNLNVLYIELTNAIKENQDVKVQINLNKKPNTYLGNYNFFDINMDDGDYSVIETNTGYSIYWLIGSMEPYEKQNCSIKIKATDIGLSDIDIQVFDYLHISDQEEIELIQSNCEKCEEEQDMWTIKDSLWTKIDNKWYKLFPDGKYKERIFNENENRYTWVDKQ